MKNTKIAILLLMILSMSYCMPGGWSDIEIESGYLTNESSPLFVSHKLLTERLAKQGISNIELLSAKKQIVNGVNYKLIFSYEMGDIKG